MVRPLLALIAAALSAPAALACGGGEYANLDDALTPAVSHVDTWLFADAWMGGEADPLTDFLYTASAQDPALFDALNKAYGWEPAPAFPGAVDKADGVFHAALVRGDYDGALNAAKEVVEGVLDLPVVLAESHTEQLRLAVEFIEVRGSLGNAAPAAVAAWFASTTASTAGVPAQLSAIAAVRTTTPEQAAKLTQVKHVRAASVRWLAIRHALQTGIPNGWSAEDIRTAAPGGFGALDAQLDAWLRDFPTHPLADYARLKKVRLAYLAGKNDAAWTLIADQYTRHPARAADELRFLYAQGALPSADVVRKLPPELAAGLVVDVPVGDATWNALWQQTEAHKDAPWAVRVQERLMLAALKAVAESPTAGLPSAFPAAAARPSDAWMRIRTAALMQAGRFDDARAQLKLAPAEPFYAPLSAQLALEAGDWVSAIRTPGLDGDAMRYLVRVLAPVEVLQQLVDDPDVGIRWEARVSIASRQLADTRDWAAGAALLEPVDAERAALWRKADALSKGTSFKKRVAFARFLASNGGHLLMNNDHGDVVWYRSLPFSAPYQEGAYAPDRAGLHILPADEWAATEAWLKRSFSTWYAVNVYADALASGGRSAGVAGGQALQAADTSYNTLLNYGSGDYYAWASILPDSAAAHKIRDFGLWYNAQ